MSRRAGAWPRRTRTSGPRWWSRPRKVWTIQQLPWIPDVQPDTVLLVLGKSLSGAVSSAYLFSPWANQLGGTG